MEPLLAPMTPAPDRTASHFTDADVASVSPLRIRLAGDAAEIDADSLISTGALAVGDRVRVEVAGRRVVVHGRAGGIDRGGYLLGMAYVWPGTSAPPAYLLPLEGQTIVGGVASYSALAAAHPEWVSGANLVLPDWRGRTPVGHLPGDSMFGTVGALIGSKTHTLSVAEMPSHSHNPIVAVVYGGNASTYRSVFATNSAFWGYDANNAVQATGGGGAHNNVQPSVVARWCVMAATSGGEYSAEVQRALVARVTELAQPPFGKISLGVAAGPTIPNATHTDVMAFQTVEAAEGILHSAGTLVVQRGGWYRLRASLAFTANATGVRLVVIRVNGTGPVDTASMVAYGPPLPGQTTVHGVTVAEATTRLNPGDVVCANGWQSSGGGLALASGAGAVAARQNYLEALFIRS